MKEGDTVQTNFITWNDFLKAYVGVIQKSKYP